MAEEALLKVYPMEPASAASIEAMEAEVAALGGNGNQPHANPPHYWWEHSEVIQPLNGNE